MRVSGFIPGEVIDILIERGLLDPRAVHRPGALTAALVQGVEQAIKRGVRPKPEKDYVPPLEAGRNRRRDREVKRKR
jgi:hypothetical protein